MSTVDYYKEETGSVFILELNICKMGVSGDTPGGSESHSMVTFDTMAQSNWNGLDIRQWIYGISQRHYRAMPRGTHSMKISIKDLEFGHMAAMRQECPVSGGGYWITWV